MVDVLVDRVARAMEQTGTRRIAVAPTVHPLLHDAAAMIALAGRHRLLAAGPTRSRSPPGPGGRWDNPMDEALAALIRFTC